MMYLVLSKNLLLSLFLTTLLMCMMSGGLQLLAHYQNYVPGMKKCVIHFQTARIMKAFEDIKERESFCDALY